MCTAFARAALVASLAMPAVAVAQARSGNASDSVDIVNVLARLNEAWRAGDASAWASAYVPDVRFVNISGMRMTSRDSLRGRMAAIFTGMFRGSERTSVLQGLRFTGRDIAIADEDVEIRGYSALPAGVVATEPGVLRTRIVHVLQRRDDRWMIVATQNTAVAPVR